MVFQDINFWGNVYPTLVALPYLHQSNGRVIINASVESWLPLPRMSLYGVSIYMHYKFDILCLLYNNNLVKKVQISGSLLNLAFIRSG